MDRGYYGEEGLNVSIDTGSGSLEAIPRVATGTYQFGFADINSLIKFRDQNSDIDVQAIMMVYDAPPFAIVGRKSLGIMEPSDLEGKTLGAPATDGAFAQWPAFVEVNNLDADTITIENVGFPVREPMLAQGDVDAITGFSFSSYINLKSKGVGADDISVLLMSDYGLKLYGNAIMVNPSSNKDYNHEGGPWVPLSLPVYMQIKQRLVAPDIAHIVDRLAAARIPVTQILIIGRFGQQRQGAPDIRPDIFVQPLTFGEAARIVQMPHADIVGRHRLEQAVLAFNPVGHPAHEVGHVLRAAGDRLARVGTVFNPQLAGGGQGQHHHAAHARRA
jgi:hypothetical protein